MKRRGTDRREEHVMSTGDRRRRWIEFTQSVTVAAGWMIGWTALLIFFGMGR